MPKPTTLGFLGAGRMATALARGFLRAGLIQADGLMASDILAEAREAFARETGGRVSSRNEEIAAGVEVLVLAVKPAQAVEVLRDLAPMMGSGHLLVSLAAGVPLSRLESALNSAVRVVRTMPNTPALVGASATAYALGRSATVDDGLLVKHLFGAVGIALEVKEELLDAVTGLSGSGPAYAYRMIEALSDGGVASGLGRDVATRLAAQTLLGAARMVLETGLHPGALRDMVASPGGTTIEGLCVLEQAGVPAGLTQAVRAATARSKELGKS